MHAACERLGKPVPDAAVQALIDNWYTTAGELAALPDETARSLGLPLRLKAVVGELLLQPEAAVESSGLQASGGSSTEEALAAARGSSDASSGDEAEEVLSDSETDSELVEELAAMRGSGGEADAAAAAAWDQAHLPIEERRCPAFRRAGFKSADLPRVTKRPVARKYALSVSCVPHGRCCCADACCAVLPDARCPAVGHALPVLTLGSTANQLQMHPAVGRRGMQQRTLVPIQCACCAGKRVHARAAS